MSNHHGRAAASTLVARLHTLGLRLTKHRAYCHTHKGLRAQVVGRGLRPTCGDCFLLGGRPK